MTEEERYKKIEIKEIPIMVGVHDEIICIPKSDEVFAAAIVGGSGTGKTLLLNRLTSCLRHQWNANVSILNDVSDETYKWSEPMNYKIFNELTMQYLHQSPCPSPLVYVYQNTVSLELPKDVQDKNYVRISLPFRKIVENIGFYLSGVLPDFELGKSGTYVDDLKDDLAKCSSISEVKDLLLDRLPGKEGKNFQAMRIKIITAFNALMKEQILDITNSEYPSYLRTESFFGNPLSTLMKAKFIPSFITSDLITKKYKSEIFSYYTNQIFENNLKDFPGEQTFLCFDELRDVCRRDDEPSSQALARVAARGRINNVGLIYCTQFYDQIPHSVRGAKLNYCFSFQHKNSEIVSEIGRDFTLDNAERKKIMNLKKFEILAMTNNKFICYNEGERYEETRPLRGTLLPPLSNHLKRGNKEDE